MSWLIKPTLFRMLKPDEFGTVPRQSRLFLFGSDNRSMTIKNLMLQFIFIDQTIRTKKQLLLLKNG